MTAQEWRRTQLRDSGKPRENEELEEQRKFCQEEKNGVMEEKSKSK